MYVKTKARSWASSVNPYGDLTNLMKGYEQGWSEAVEEMLEWLTSEGCKFDYEDMVSAICALFKNDSETLSSISSQSEVKVF